MKILYVYDSIPDVYQNYMFQIVVVLRSSLNIKTLSYNNCEKYTDFKIKSYGLKDYFQRTLYKLKLSKTKSSDIIVFKKFDIVHLQHSYLFSKLFPLLINPRKTKTIITLRGADTYLKPWKDKKWKNFYANEGHLIDAFITVSQHQKEYLIKWGIVSEKIHVIPVSFGNHSNAEPKYPNQSKLKLVSAFRMTWEKNIEGSIQFAILLKEKGVDFQYDIFGDGQDLSQLYYLVDRYDLKKHVNIKGKVDNDVLKSSLIDYDFFLQLSISEALSVSVLEAQSFGLPCVVSNSDGLKEAVIPNKTGICGNYNDLEYFVDETMKLWRNSEKYYQFSKAAIDFVNNNFTLAKEEERLKKMYKEIYKDN